MPNDQSAPTSAETEYGQWWGAYSEDGRLLLLSPNQEAAALGIYALSQSRRFGTVEIRRQPAADVYLASFLEASRG